MRSHRRHSVQVSQRRDRYLDTANTVKRICSWCGSVVFVGSTADAAITHTICASCMAKIEREIEESQRLKEAKTNESPTDRGLLD